MFNKPVFNALLSLLFICASQQAARAQEYLIDPDHSSVGFKVRHLGISSVSGNFLKFEGSFMFNESNFPSSKAQAEITSASINTQHAKRDEHLRSADFLTADKFPEIKFMSTKIEGSSPQAFKLYGDLSIKGVTKPVVLDVALGGKARDPWGNERAAFSAKSKINRKDFGLVWNKLLESGSLVVGEEVEIVLEVEGIKKKT